MNAYIFQAALYCGECGRDIRRRIRKEGKAPEFPKDETTYDSDEYPKGPYEDGGGESDVPEHCGSGEHCLQAMELPSGWKVGCWLENPLTLEGARYVLEAAGEPGADTNEVVQFWLQQYDEEVDNARKRPGR